MSERGREASCSSWAKCQPVNLARPRAEFGRLDYLEEDLGQIYLARVRQHEAFFSRNCWTRRGPNSTDSGQVSAQIGPDYNLSIDFSRPHWLTIPATAQLVVFKRFGDERICDTGEGLCVVTCAVSHWLTWSHVVKAGMTRLGGFCFARYRLRKSLPQLGRRSGAACPMTWG